MIGVPGVSKPKEIQRKRERREEIIRVVFHSKSIPDKYSYFPFFFLCPPPTTAPASEISWWRFICRRASMLVAGMGAPPMRRIGSFAEEVRRVRMGERMRASLRSSMLMMTGAGFVSKELRRVAISLPSDERWFRKRTMGLRAQTSSTISSTSRWAFSERVSKPQMSWGSTGR